MPQVYLFSTFFSANRRFTKFNFDMKHAIFFKTEVLFNLPMLADCCNIIIELIFFSSKCFWKCSALLKGTFMSNSFHGLLAKRHDFSDGPPDAMLKVCATFYTHFMLPLYFCFYLSTPLFLTMLFCLGGQ